MGLIIPPSVNYRGTLVAVPSRVLDTPIDGNRQVSCEIDWDPALVGAGKSVVMNLNQNATLAFSQIVALKVDNSQCNADVTFIFPDTGDTITIPAESPYALVPVFTNNKYFYVSSPGSLIEDITRFQVLNFLPPPVTVPTSNEQNAVSNQILNMVNTAAQEITSGEPNGTLESLVIQATIASAAAVFSTEIQILDSRSQYCATAIISGPIGYTFNGAVLSVPNINFRFIGGLFMKIAGTFPGGVASVQPNLFYRTP